MKPGDNLINNPLDNDINTLASLFFYQIPNGTMVKLWNPTTGTYDTSSTYSGGAWSANLFLPPGTGFLLNIPTSITNLFTGNVQNHDGSRNFSDFSPPPLFTGMDGIYLLGDKCPMQDVGNDIFLNLLGRIPNPGEQVTTLNSSSQTYTTSTYLGNNIWDSVPVLDVGYAAFLNVHSVPEPATISLLGLGFAFGGWAMKRRCRMQANDR